MVTVTALLCGCPRSPGVVEPEGLEAQQRVAEANGRSRALENLTLASMAVEAGDTALAEGALRTAVGIMGSPRADGEWRALIGREGAKEWKGEPYERIAAHLALGHLLYAEGDRGNALAMYKSAVLSDTGTSGERYRSDLVVGWVLQGLVLQGEGEADVAVDLFRRAADAVWATATLDRLTESLHAADPNSAEPGTERAREALFAALPAGVAASPRDPARAVEAATSRAVELMQNQRGLTAAERRQALQRFSKADFDQASRALPGLVTAWKARVAADTVEPPDRAQALEALSAARPNVVVLIEDGRGPTKRAEGTYGERLVIVPGRAGRAPRVRFAGEAVDPLFLDSLSHQASTRGGRRVDGWLQGKALYKDTGLLSGYFLIYLSQELAWRGSRQESTLLAVAGATLMTTAALTIPEADTRAWEQAPESWYLATATLQPGAQTLVVGDRDIELTIPPSGQTFVFAPARGPLITR